MKEVQLNYGQSNLVTKSSSRHRALLFEILSKKTLAGVESSRLPPLLLQLIANEQDDSRCFRTKNPRQDSCIFSRLEKP